MAKKSFPMAVPWEPPPPRNDEERFCREYEDVKYKMPEYGTSAEERRIIGSDDGTP